jgi:hypothetical protein
VCFIIHNGYAQKAIIVNDANGGNMRSFNVLDSAIKKANSGDFIYIPGGSFNITVTINKPLQIFGAGYRLDSSKATGITMISGNVVLVKGADNTSLNGLYMNNYFKLGTNDQDKVVNNILINRCSINQYSLCYNDNCTNTASNITFNECVFRFNWVYNGYNTTNIKFTRCIFNVRVFNQTGGAEFSNCIFLFRDKGWAVFNYVTNCLVKNCIFLQEDLISYSGSTLTINNSLFASNTTEADMSGIVLNNNVYDYPTDSIFAKVEKDYWFDLRKNYHLNKKVSTMIKGTDGTEIGIYGTAYPFKDGAFPVNPRIKFNSIAPATDAQGKIKVDIKVDAQEY